MMAVLEVRCAVPGCVWTGSPADAPNHECPTTDVAASDNGGRQEATPEPVEEVDGEAEEIDIDEADRRGLIPPTGRTIDIDAEPADAEEMALWLNEHGDYTDEGVPNDEKTARLDAKLAALGEEPFVDAPEPDLSAPPTAPEPDALTGSGEFVQTTPGETPADGPRPWQIPIAEELERQPTVAGYRWLVILKATETEEATLIGRGRVKSDAQEILDKVVEQGTDADDLEIVKTADVLDYVAALASESGSSDEGAKPEPEPAEAAQDGQDAPEAATETEEPPVEPDGQTTLIDRSAYESEELALPKVDGHGIDRISVGFTGRIMLDRSDKADVALYRKLALGQEVELRVAGRVSGTGAKGATGRDGDLDVVVGEKTIAIGTVYVLTAEDL